MGPLLQYLLDHWYIAVLGTGVAAFLGVLGVQLIARRLSGGRDDLEPVPGDDDVEGVTEADAGDTQVYVSGVGWVTQSAVAPAGAGVKGEHAGAQPTGDGMAPSYEVQTAYSPDEQYATISPAPPAVPVGPTVAPVVAGMDPLVALDMAAAAFAAATVGRHTADPTPEPDGGPGDADLPESEVPAIADESGATTDSMDQGGASKPGDADVESDEQEQEQDADEVLPMAVVASEDESDVPDENDVLGGAVSTDDILNGAVSTRDSQGVDADVSSATDVTETAADEEQPAPELAPDASDANGEQDDNLPQEWSPSSGVTLEADDANEVAASSGDKVAAIDAHEAPPDADTTEEVDTFDEDAPAPAWDNMLESAAEPQPAAKPRRWFQFGRRRPTEAEENQAPVSDLAEVTRVSVLPADRTRVQWPQTPEVTAGPEPTPATHDTVEAPEVATEAAPTSDDGHAQEDMTSATNEDSAAADDVTPWWRASTVESISDDLDTTGVCPGEDGTATGTLDEAERTERDDEDSELTAGLIEPAEGNHPEAEEVPFVTEQLWSAPEDVSTPATPVDEPAVSPFLAPAASLPVPACAVPLTRRQRRELERLSEHPVLPAPIAFPEPVVDAPTTGDALEASDAEPAEDGAVEADEAWPARKALEGPPAPAWQDVAPDPLPKKAGWWAARKQRKADRAADVAPAEPAPAEPLVELPEHPWAPPTEPAGVDNDVLGQDDEADEGDEPVAPWPAFPEAASHEHWVLPSAVSPVIDHHGSLPAAPVAPLPSALTWPPRTEDQILVEDEPAGADEVTPVSGPPVTPALPEVPAPAPREAEADTCEPAPEQLRPTNPELTPASDVDGTEDDQWSPAIEQNPWTPQADRAVPAPDWQSTETPALPQIPALPEVTTESASWTSEVEPTFELPDWLQAEGRALPQIPSLPKVGTLPSEDADEDAPSIGLPDWLQAEIPALPKIAAAVIPGVDASRAPDPEVTSQPSFGYGAPAPDWAHAEQVTTDAVPTVPDWAPENPAAAPTVPVWNLEDAGSGLAPTMELDADRPTLPAPIPVSPEKKGRRSWLGRRRSGDLDQAAEADTPDDVALAEQEQTAELRAQVKREQEQALRERLAQEQAQALRAQVEHAQAEAERAQVEREQAAADAHRAELARREAEQADALQRERDKRAEEMRQDAQRQARAASEQQEAARKAAGRQEAAERKERQKAERRAVREARKVRVPRRAQGPDDELRAAAAAMLASARPVTTHAPTAALQVPVTPATAPVGPALTGTGEQEPAAFVIGSSRRASANLDHTAYDLPEPLPRALQS